MNLSYFIIVHKETKERLLVLRVNAIEKKELSTLMKLAGDITVPRKERLEPVTKFMELIKLYKTRTL